MAYRLRGALRFAIVAVVTSGALGLTVYQNCAGNTGTGLGGPSQSALISSLAAKPMPVSMNFNQISYMSCPGSFGGNTGNSGDPLGNPFYQLRFGGFNNSASNGFTAIPSGASVAPNSIAGIGFSTAAMNYMRSVNPNPTSAMLSNFIKSSPYSGGSQPVASLVNQVRSACTTSSCGGLSADAAAVPLFVPLATPDLVTQLSAAIQIAGAGTQPISFYSDSSLGSNAVEGSLSSTMTGFASAENQFRTELGNLVYLAAGFAPTTAQGASSIIQALQSPDGSPAQRIFANGYRIGFSSAVPSAVTNISEYDLSTSPNSPTAVGGSWQCLNLTVVRDLDRKYWTTSAASTVASPYLAYLASLTQQQGLNNQVTMAAGTPVHPMDVSSMAGLQENYLRDSGSGVVNNSIPYLMYNLMFRYTSYAGALGISSTKYTSPTFGGIVPGIGGGTVPLYMGYGSIDGGNYYSCPPEDPSTLIGNPVAMQELKVIRRFLLPEYWDVNITEMCAVPKAAAESIGSCYPNNGDTNATNYIQYNGTPGVTCYNGAPNTNSSLPPCAATVSVCWRYQ